MPALAGMTANGLEKDHPRGAGAPLLEIAGLLGDIALQHRAAASCENRRDALWLRDAPDDYRRAQPKRRGRQDDHRDQPGGDLGASGAHVLLVDADPQASAMAWSTTRERDPFFGDVGMAKPTLHRDLPALAGNYDVVIIDGAPRVNELAARPSWRATWS